MLKDRSVRNYFKLRKLAWELAQFHWGQDKEHLGEAGYEKYRKEDLYKIVTELDEKADRLYAVDVARSYYYHIRHRKNPRRKVRRKRAKRR